MTLVYERLLRPLFFLQDPERIHERMVRLGALLGALAPARWLLSLAYGYKDERLWQDIGGITFENPVGLAAGFDKDADLPKVLPSIGFGHVEVGSVTAKPYAGNEGVRLKRLVADEAIIVNYGLKSAGAKAVAAKLKDCHFRVPVGVSVARTNATFKSEKAKLDDWMTGLKTMKACGDYLTLNLSCPNTNDATNYCDPGECGKLFARVERERLRFGKPVFLKVGADLAPKQADRLIALARPRAWVTGFIISNLGKDRASLGLKTAKQEHAAYRGGISGPAVRKKALALVKHFRKRGGKRFVLIACGGVSSAKDAYAYLAAGASLIQLVTSLIYKGPGVVKEINKGLVALLAQDGYASVGDAVGKA